METLPESWLPRKRFRDSAEVPRPHHTFTSGASEIKPRLRARSTEKIAKLEPQIGSLNEDSTGVNLEIQ